MRRRGGGGVGAINNVISGSKEVFNQINRSLSFSGVGFGGRSTWKSPKVKIEDRSEILTYRLPKKVGSYRSLHYQVSNQWSSQCRVRCLQIVNQYDSGGGGIVVTETRQLPDIPWGRNFIVVRKISILYVGNKTTKLIISSELREIQPKQKMNGTWPIYVHRAVAREMHAMW